MEIQVDSTTCILKMPETPAVPFGYGAEIYW